MSDFYIYATSIDLGKVKEYYKEDPVAVLSEFYIYATSLDIEKVKEYYKEAPVVDLNDRWRSEYGFEYARTEDKKLRLQFRSETDLVMFSMRFCK